MEENFEKVKSYLVELGHDISIQDDENQLLVINDERAGISNLVFGCADPILIMEQNMFDVPKGDGGIFKELLKKNKSKLICQKEKIFYKIKSEIALLEKNDSNHFKI